MQRAQAFASLPLCPQRFVWTKHWYPVASLLELDPSRPTQLTLLGEDYVLWKDGSGNWRAFADRCPHRLAPLSEGRVESDGTLLCAYHAWRFDGSGACTRIPQAKDEQQETQARNNPRACATAFPTKVEQVCVIITSTFQNSPSACQWQKAYYAVITMVRYRNCRGPLYAHAGHGLAVA